MRLLSLFRGSRSASSSETAFSDGPRSDSRTTVGEQTESASSGPTLLRLGSPKSFPAIAHLPETRQIVVKQVIKDVFDSTFFSICKINKLLEESGWCFFDHATGKANIVLEPKVKLTKAAVDALGDKLGLTATPRDYLKKFDAVKPGTRDPREVERRLLLDTYNTFGCGSGEPTFRYSLIDGVREGYLINPVKVDA